MTNFSSNAENCSKSDILELALEVAVLYWSLKKIKASGNFSLPIAILSRPTVKANGRFIKANGRFMLYEPLRGGSSFKRKPSVSVRVRDFRF